MKFIYLKSKVRMYQLITLITIAGGTANIYACATDEPAVAHEESIIVICREKFDQFVDEFSTTFKDSFSIDSKEPFNITGKKLIEVQKKLEQLTKWLHDEAQKLAATKGQCSIEYQYVNELIHIANEFFKKHFVPLVTSFNKNYKQNITKFIGTLKKEIEPIVSEASFQTLKKHLDKLQQLCHQSGHAEIADKYNLIWKVANEARDEYLKTANPAVLSKWRTRIPK